MITVVILINGRPIIATSAHRIEKEVKAINTYYLYRNKKKIKHRPKDGAVKLAIKMLRQIG